MITLYSSPPSNYSALHLSLQSPYSMNADHPHMAPSYDHHFSDFSRSDVEISMNEDQDGEKELFFTLYLERAELRSKQMFASVSNDLDAILTFVRDSLDLLDHSCS